VCARARARVCVCVSVCVVQALVVVAVTQLVTAAGDGSGPGGGSSGGSRASGGDSGGSVVVKQWWGLEAVTMVVEGAAMQARADDVSPTHLFEVVRLVVVVVATVMGVGVVAEAVKCLAVKLKVRADGASARQTHLSEVGTNVPSCSLVVNPSCDQYE
jgi:uncharacterized membrane protein YgcG